MAVRACPARCAAAGCTQGKAAANPGTGATRSVAASHELRQVAAKTRGNPSVLRWTQSENSRRYYSPNGGMLGPRNDLEREGAAMTTTQPRATDSMTARTTSLIGRTKSLTALTQPGGRTIDLERYSATSAHGRAEPS